MHCKNCGNAVRQGQGFCISCGARLDSKGIDFEESCPEYRFISVPPPKGIEPFSAAGFFAGLLSVILSAVFYFMGKSRVAASFWLPAVFDLIVSAVGMYRAKKHERRGFCPALIGLILSIALLAVLLYMWVESLFKGVFFQLGVQNFV